MRSVSSRPTIICPRCQSYRTVKVKPVLWRDRLREWFRTDYVAGDRQAGSYACGSCAFKFEVHSAEEHCRAHPPDFHRCRSCDQTTVELVETNHRYSQWQPPDEVVDLYRCTHCSTNIHLIVQEDPSTLYG